MIVYLAHPLGGDTAANAKRARRWLRWLMENEPDGPRGKADATVRAGADRWLHAMGALRNG